MAEREPQRSSQPEEPGRPGAGAEDPLADERKRKPERQDPERDPHHELNNPVGEPDPTEWPDPYEKRPDPRGGDGEDDESGPIGPSTSEPHPPATWERSKREGEGTG